MGYYHPLTLQVRTEAETTLHDVGLYEKLPASKRLLIGIAGIPGSGKAHHLPKPPNRLYTQSLPLQSRQNNPRSNNNFPSQHPLHIPLPRRR